MLRVKEICKQKGISQKDLADRLGISPSALAQSVGGNPGLDKVVSIANALNVTVSDLVGDKEPDNSIVCPNCGKRFIMEDNK
ncbi:MAG: helix-turn-helix transcriptional regulator [Oscillospiraceae bacterium]|nr:helix-turn-helix transcriptional regulator [Oscillospiraceae bacterium]